MGAYREYQAYSLGRQERGGSRRLRRGGDASSSAAQPDVGTSLSGLSFIKILFRACRERREREPRSPLRESPRRRFHATINVLSPPPRRGHHTLVRARRGAASSRGHTCCYLFLFRSLSYVRKSQVPFVCLSVRSFVCSFISRGQSKSKTKKGDSVKKTEETPRRHQKTRQLLKFVQKWRTGFGCCSA